MVHLTVGADEIVARISRSAAGQLAFQPGDAAHAVLKSMSLARDHIAKRTVSYSQPRRLK
ncbi:TOBE domain-containing protein [Neotabrizicola shimadae]|nr:TOBE domain-containing protein [Neotabrizicola shimadae]